MRKVTIFFMIILINGLLHAQTNIADPTKNDTLTAIPSNPGDFYMEFVDRSNPSEGWIKLMSMWRLMQLMAISGDQIVPDAWNFTGTVQLPSNLPTELINGVGFPSGLFAWVYNDTIRFAADRAWVQQLMADSGFAVDSNNFVTKAGDETITGNKNYSGTNIFEYRVALGSGENSGEILIPFYTGSNKPSDIHRMWYANPNTKKMYINMNGTWVPYLDSAGVKSMLQTGVFVTVNTNQSGLYGNKTHSAGTITPFILSFGGADAGRSLLLPIDKNDVVLQQLASVKLDKNDAYRFMVHNGSGWVGYVMQSEFDADVTTLIEESINYNAPDSLNGDYNGGTVTLSMLDNTVGAQAHIYQDNNQPDNIIITDYGVNRVCTFLIEPLGNETNLTISISGVSLKYGDHPEPNWEDGSRYWVQITGLKPTIADVSWKKIY